MIEKDLRLKIDLSRQLLRRKLTDMPDRDITWLQTELLNEINLSLSECIDLLRQLNATTSSLRESQ